MTTRIVTAREQVEMLSPWRVAIQSTPNPLSRLHRGIALRREDMPPALTTQLEESLGGKHDPSLGPNLLNHLNSKGMGEWWVSDPASAERFSINQNPSGRAGPNAGLKAHYQVVVSGDGDTTSAESAMGKRYWRFPGGTGVTPQSVRVRRQHPDDWLEAPLSPGQGAPQ